MTAFVKKHIGWPTFIGIVLAVLFVATVAIGQGIDDAAYGVATSRVNPVGLLFDDTSPDSVNEGDIGAQRMSANRNAYTTIRDAAGNERGANVDASNQLAVADSAAAALLTTIDADTGALVVDLAAIEVLQTSIDGTLTTIDADTGALVVDLAAIEVLQTSIDGTLTTIDADTGAMAVDLAAIEVLQTTIAGDTTSIDADTSAMVTDLAAIEVLQTTIAGDTTSIDADTSAMVTDLAAIEVLLGTIDTDTGAMVTDLAAIEVLLGTIDTDTGNIATSVASIDTDTSTIAGDTTSIDADTSAMVTDLAAIEVLLGTIDTDTGAMVTDLAAIEVLQTSIEGDTTAIQTAVEVMDDWDNGADQANIDIAAVSVTALPISDDASANSETNPIYTEKIAPVLDADDTAACLAIPAAEADYTVTHDQTQICASGNTVYILCANAAPVTADHTVGNFSIVVPDGMCLGPYDFTGLTVCSYIGVAAGGFVCFLGSDYN